MSLQIARVYWRVPEDYKNIQMDVDIQSPNFLDLLKEATKELPRRLNITNIEEIPEDYLKMLGLKHREHDITFNGYMVKSCHMPTAYYKFVDIDYDRIPINLSDMIIDNDGTTCGEILRKTKGKGIHKDIFPKIMECFREYTRLAHEKVRTLNQIEDWRQIEDFYTQVMYIGMRTGSFKTYSPSGKTYIEACNYLDYRLDSEDLEEELSTDLETIQTHMKNYALNVPDIMVIKDSVPTWKTKYTKQTFSDIPLPDSDIPLIMEALTEEDVMPTMKIDFNKSKFHGYTRPLETIVYWPDSAAKLKMYYNDTLERNIPNVIRKELKPVQVQPNKWYNLNEEYAKWLDTLPEDIQKEFYPLDSEVCPVCQTRYNIYQGCLDPHTEEYHVEPILETKRNIEHAVIEYYDSSKWMDEDLCFCQRVERYLNTIKRNGTKTDRDRQLEKLLK